MLVLRSLPLSLFLSLLLVLARLSSLPLLLLLFLLDLSGWVGLDLALRSGLDLSGLPVLLSLLGLAFWLRLGVSVLLSLLDLSDLPLSRLSVRAVGLPVSLPDGAYSASVCPILTLALGRRPFHLARFSTLTPFSRAKPIRLSPLPTRMLLRRAGAAARAAGAEMRGGGAGGFSWASKIWP